MSQTELEILKQANDKIEDDEGTEDSIEDNDGINGVVEDNDGTNDGVEDNDGTNGGVEDNDGTNGGDEDNDGTYGSVEGDVPYVRYEDSYNKKDESSLFYGTIETQVSEGGEADLHKHLVDCKKNPGHTCFVPVSEFNIRHLPEDYRGDTDLFEYIKATADLTVRLGVKMTSSERPMYMPDTKVPYDIRGSTALRTGTGFIYHVDIWSEAYNKNFKNGNCQCSKCLRSDTPSKVWGRVRVNTAKHVVYDDIEARESTCRLFYDSSDSPLVTIDGWRKEPIRNSYRNQVAATQELLIHNPSARLNHLGIERYGMMQVNTFPTQDDWIVIDYVTCDIDLLNKIKKMMNKWWELWNKIEPKYARSRDDNKLVFIVSHPHGCSKQVSLGHWTKRLVVAKDDFSREQTKYTYTTGTCPGSSGAHVHKLGYGNGNYGDLSIHVHSGINSEGENFCGVGMDY